MSSPLASAFITWFAVLGISVCSLLPSRAQLPCVRLYTTGELSRDFSPCLFSLDDTATLPADIRYRGGTTMSRQKKSFAIKLKGHNGEKNDTSLLGMRKDNYWVLDAMAVDVSRMRNRVSMDLWNDFSRASYIMQMDGKARNGTEGRFVELYLNDEYWGVYCLSERLDRKQLRLMKSTDEGVRGALYKSVSKSTLYSKEASYYDYDNNSETWNGWELSYPSLSDDERIDWAPLAEMIHWLSYSPTTEIRKYLNRKIDTAVWQDYFLLMEFICAEDNVFKNQYVYFFDVTEEDRMLGVAPWDMDHSWGRDWSGQITPKTSAEYNLQTIYNRVCQLLCSNPSLLETSFKDRYAELRTTYFEPESLKNRFRTYFSSLLESGAAERERQRWSGIDGIELDFEAEREYILEWIDSRIRYMDKKYNYTVTDISCSVHTHHEEVKEMYDLDGHVLTGVIPVRMPGHKIYVINRKKIQP